jgi:hypothetical protein
MPKVMIARPSPIDYARGLLRWPVTTPAALEQPFIEQFKSETMAITDPGNPCNIGEIGTSS